MDKKGSIATIVAIVLLALGLVSTSGYIVYDKVLSKNNDVKKEILTDNETEEKQSYTNWLDYVLDQDIKSIKATGFLLADDSSIDINGKEIAPEQFQKLYGRDVTYIMQGGVRGIPVGVNVEYIKNGNTYSLQLDVNIVRVDNIEDPELKSLFTDNAKIVDKRVPEDIAAGEEYGNYIVDFDYNYFSTLFK